MPRLNPLEYLYAEIYQICSGARNSMSGSIEYGVIMDIAKAKGLTDFEDLLYYVNSVENEIQKKNKAKS